MYEAVALLALTLVCPIIIGVPLRLALSRGRTWTETEWIQTPFLGLAFILFVFQPLIYLSIPVDRALPWFWAIVGVGWLVTLATRSARATLATFPLPVFATALAVYLVQAAGYLAAGPEFYLGRYLGDQFNYVSMAHWFAYVPHDTPPDSISETPFLVPASDLRDDRIGQSIIHAFLTATTRTESLRLYEPLSCSALALLALAIHDLAGRFGASRRHAALIALTAGLFPSATLLHLQGFLSHVLMLPFLFILFPCLHDLLRRPGVETLSVTMIVVAAGASIYTEFCPVQMGIVGVVLGAGASLRCQSWRRTAVLVVAIASAPALLNPLFAPRMIPLLTRTVSAPFAQETLPDATWWIYECVWFGDFVAVFQRPTSISVQVRLLTGLAGLGLLRLCWTCRARNAPDDPASRDFARSAIALGMVAVTCIPLVILLKRQVLLYQFWKLSLTIGPLLVLGIGLWATAQSRHSARLLQAAICAYVLFRAAAGTGAMIHDTWRERPHCASLTAYCLTDDLKQVYQALGQLDPGDLVLSVAADEGHSPRNGWLTWHARHHRVQITDRWLNEIDIGSRPGMSRDALARVGSECLLLLDSDIGVDLKPSQGASCVLRAGRYSLWRLSGDRWVIPMFAGDSTFRPADRPSLDATRELEVYSHHQTRITLAGRGILTGATSQGLKVRAESDRIEAVEVGPTVGDVSISLTIPPGRTRIRLTLLADQGSPRWADAPLGISFGD